MVHFLKYLIIALGKTLFLVILLIYKLIISYLRAMPGEGKILRWENPEEAYNTGASSGIGLSYAEHKTL